MMFLKTPAGSLRPASFRGNAVNVLTAQPQLYTVLGDDPPIIEV